jgi:hypothetical protein
MKFLYLLFILPLVLLSISSIIIWKLQHEITVSKEINLQSMRLLEQLSDQGSFEHGSRRLGSSTSGNCSAIMEEVTNNLNWRQPKSTYLTSPFDTFKVSFNPTPLYLKVRMVGGGAGGASTAYWGTNWNRGQNGQDTSFGGYSLLVAYGGSGQASDLGGSGSVGSGANGFILNGGQGMDSITSDTNFPGSLGGSTPFGTTVNPATPNVGSGGASGGVPCTGGTGTFYYTGSGGGAGGYVEAIISQPAASYAYTVGTGGSGGFLQTDCTTRATDTSCCAPGRSGGNGIIIVEEHFK